MIYEKLKAYLHLMRPFEWSKSLANMVIAALLALFISNSLASITFETIVYFISAFIAVGPFLWSGLYSLNDWTDIEKDKMHPVKKSRPMPSGFIPSRSGLIFSLTLIALAVITAFFINFLFLICILAMLINQLLYTIPPIKLKEKPVLDLISGSLINPVFRFYAGWVLFIPAFNAPILFLIFILGLQFGGYTMYRLSSKSLEEKLNYKSSTVVFGEKAIKRISYISILIGGLSYIFITLNGEFFPSLDFLGYLPIRFFYFSLLMLVPAPLYYKALKDPQGMDMKGMYKLLYTHLTVFIIGFISLFFISF